jgi:putative membrane protein
MRQISRSIVTIYSRRFLVTGGVLLISGALAVAQQQPMGSSPSTANPGNPANSNPNSPMSPTAQMQAQQNAAAGSMQDKAFLRKALEGGMFEVQAGQLATQKSSSQDVQQFGQKMVDDHTKLGDQMKPIAAQMGVPVPTKLSKKDQATLTKLQGMSGSQFDNAYVKDMVSDHKKDLSDFKQEAGNTQNPDLKQATQQGAQVISEHLHMAEQLAKAHNVSGKM